MNPELKKALVKFKKPFICDHVGDIYDSYSQKLIDVNISKGFSGRCDFKKSKIIGTAIAEFLNKAMEEEG